LNSQRIDKMLHSLAKFAKRRRVDLCYLIFGGILILPLTSWIITQRFSISSTPMFYDGDGLWYLNLFKQLQNQFFLFENSNLGFPFGNNYFDFPIYYNLFNVLGFVVAKFTQNLGLTFNIIYLLGFSFTFISTYVVSRFFKMKYLAAFVLAVLFAYLPFHFGRIGHINVSLYSEIPIIFLIAASLSPKFPDSKLIKLRTPVSLFLLFLLGQINVYSTVFSALVLLSFIIASLFLNYSFHSIKNLIYGVFVLVSTQLLVFVPSIIWILKNGSNSDAISRTAADSEIYGLKFIQLILPHPGHRFGVFSELNQKYSSSAPLVNENISSSLGILSTIGMVVVILSFLKPKLQSIDLEKYFFGVAFIVILSFASIGGLGSVFSYIVTPQIRAWNRLVPVLAFISIFILIRELLKLIEKNSKKIQNQSFIAMLLIGILSFGVWDQTSKSCQECLTSASLAYDSDRSSGAFIEEIAPTNSSFYQMPYVSFPGHVKIGEVSAYTHSLGFLFTEKNFYWSFGTIRGRQGNGFFETLSREPLSKQVTVATAMGFNYIYLDTRGYPNMAASEVQELISIVGQQNYFGDNSSRVALFRLPNNVKENPPFYKGQITPETYDYYADSEGVRLPVAPLTEIDFRINKLPSVVKKLSGMSGFEPWGRWTSDSQAKIVFWKKQSKREVVIEFTPFESNIDSILEIKVAGKTKLVQMKAGLNSVKVNLRYKEFDEIVFLTKNNQSPLALGINADTRSLGIGLFSLTFKD
jgi:phosphoglycerol transferase